MSRATKLWDEWYPQFIAKHKLLGELEPTLSYSDRRWDASIQIRQYEPYEGTWLEDIGVSGWGSTPLTAVEACIEAGEAYQIAEAERMKKNELRRIAARTARHEAKAGRSQSTLR